MPTINVRKHTDDTVSIVLNLDESMDYEYSIEVITKLYYEMGMAIKWYNSLVKGEK